MTDVTARRAEMAGPAAGPGTAPGSAAADTCFAAQRAEMAGPEAGPGTAPGSAAAVTYFAARRQVRELLEENGVPDADYDALALLEFTAGLSRTEYFLRAQEVMPEPAREAYAAAARRRAAREPLQYITGQQAFCGLLLEVDEHVLIPRQDTETLVEETRRTLHGGERVLDLCTGSGCIILALKSLCPSIEAVATDISAGALEKARRNAERTGLAVTFVQGDLFEALGGTELPPAARPGAAQGDLPGTGNNNKPELLPQAAQSGAESKSGSGAVSGRFDRIVSNPPYIESDVIGTLDAEVKDFEPRLALDGGPDGLDLYRRIIGEAPAHLTAGGQLLLEIGAAQGPAVSELLRAAGFTDVRVVKDLSGLDRVAAGRLA